MASDTTWERRLSFWCLCSTPFPNGTSRLWGWPSTSIKNLAQFLRIHTVRAIICLCLQLECLGQVGVEPTTSKEMSIPRTPLNSATLIYGASARTLQMMLKELQDHPCRRRVIWFLLWSRSHARAVVRRRRSIYTLPACVTYSVRFGGCI